MHPWFFTMRETFCAYAIEVVKIAFGLMIKHLKYRTRDLYLIHEKFAHGCGETKHVL